MGDNGNDGSAAKAMKDELCRDSIALKTPQGGRADQALGAFERLLHGLGRLR